MNRIPKRSPHPVISRAELLGGLVGRRVSSALYAIESRSAYLSLQARHATAPAISEGVLEEQERAFLATLAAGRDMSVSPSIQQIEQFAPQWAFLVPDDAVARAELAQRLGAKYRFRGSDVPRVRAALRLDDPAVHRAYRERRRAELDAAYATDLSWRERWRWTWSRLLRRLEELPPFWTAFGLTLTGTAGAGMLALPIVTAGIGPLPGLFLIVVIGLLNVLTIAAVAEAFTRTASVRWGGAFFGRVVIGYLGQTGGVLFTVILLVRGAPVLLACYLGFAATSAHTTGIPAPVWAALLFALNVTLIYRRRLDLTIASALMVGAVNVVAIVLLVVLALPAADTAHLSYAAVPFVGNHPFDTSLIDVLLGVVLLSYYGHTSVGNCAQVVLRRDPGGRSLIAGSLAAIVTVVALYAGWVLAVSSAVPRERLAAETGTSLAPLDDVVGPAASILGFVFIFLALGMNSVHVSLGLYNLVAERFLPSRRLAAAAGFLAVGAIFVLAVLLLITQRASFAGSLGFVGAITGPLLCGAFPVLLLLASRRRGEYPPARAWAWLGRPVVAGLVFAVFFGIALLYAWIWPWPQRLMAIASALVIVVLVVLGQRSGAMRPRAVVEIRRSQETGRDWLTVVASGRQMRSEVLPAGTRAVPVDVRPLNVGELRAWAHEVDPAGGSRPLRVSARLRNGSESAPHVAPDGALTLQLDDRHEVLELSWPSPTPGVRR